MTTLGVARIDIGTDCAPGLDMDDTPPKTDRLGAIEGADSASLGLTGDPEPAPPGAQVDDSGRLVPGAGDNEPRLGESKPWQTTLAARDEGAGVANDPPDAQPPLYPNEAVTRAEDETDPH
jgi:hypothetical protein